MVEKVLIESSIEFNFPIPENIPPPILKIEDGSFGYSADKILKIIPDNKAILISAFFKLDISKYL